MISLCRGNCRTPSGSSGNFWDTCFRVNFWRQKTFKILTCVTLPTRKSESHLQSLVVRSSWQIVYVNPLCQTLSNDFSTSMKVAITCSPQLKLSIMAWERRKRWSFGDLDFLKTYWYLLNKPLSWRCFGRRFWMTRSKSFIIALSKLMDR